jgi:translation initiation factor 2 subunit 3
MTTKPKEKKAVSGHPEKEKTEKKEKPHTEKSHREKQVAEQAEINIGMVGHVDHGKTSLTKALTGKWTDTHSEELKRGISIRLGYADTTFYKCEHCKGSEAYGTKDVCAVCGKKAKKLRRISIVDAPGHETLMTTMLSGAALMNGAILVVAANEPVPQPRTQEHLMALKAAGTEHFVVAQNKIDLVDKAKAIENEKKIIAFLKENGYENIPIVPTVANFGINIDLLIEAIEKSIPTPKFEANKSLKMFVARSFDVNKPGTTPEKLVGAILGGSITQGIAKIGDEIEISPGIEEKPLKTKIASLSTETGFLEKATPGGLIAIGTLLDPELSHNDQMKGQVVGAVGTLPTATKKLSLKYFVFKRVVEEMSNDLKTNDLIVLTIGTNTALGTITKTSPSNIEVILKNAVIVEKGQKIAISKKQKTGWRLAAYGITA